MKPATLATAAVAFALLAGQTLFMGRAAMAQSADDAKWVGQCLIDNAGGAAEPIVRKYCVCMNNKMSDNETRSITQWEKSNPAARAACDKEAGWR
ncbi:hypothetical protein SAMN05216304_111139 [Bosea sp. OK403]|uniref:hypothetical protein n=1 Tax=Bosea sp. OK403 TaxID=1855286 RepID=UPI0008DFBCAE|nr:hypothetical protein [Bosea sp. OK403]SFJ67913.1 hypothetical protein SAMN05216304_111139 [Bosea sp. OK403]